MTLIRWAPRTGLEGMRRDPMFGRFWDLLDGEVTDTERSWHPAMDLVEESDRLVARVELPGIDPNDVHVNLQGDMLHVEGERKEETKTEKGKILKREQVYGTFHRTVQLPYRVQNDKVKAHYKNGIMTIELPKSDEDVGRQIPVEFEK